MQTTVNVKQAFGIAGEIYDLTPYRVDSRIVAAPATIPIEVMTDLNLFWLIFIQTSRKSSDNLILSPYFL